MRYFVGWAAREVRLPRSGASSVWQVPISQVRATRSADKTSRTAAARDKRRLTTPRGVPARVPTKKPVLQSISYPTLRQTRLRDEPVAAMCVRKSSARRVLQFTPFNAASCVLHRPASRVIHRLQLYCFWFLLIAQRGVQVRDLKRRLP